MKTDNDTAGKLNERTLLDTMIRFGVVATLVILCFRVFSPFASIMLWGLTLAIMLYPLHQKLANKVGGRQGPAAALLVLVGFLLLGTPLVFLGGSLVDHIQQLHGAVESNELAIKPPAASVAEWPVIGKRLYAAWNDAAASLPQFLTDYRPQLQKLSKRAVSAAANALGSVFLFLGALAIAGIMMAWGKQGSGAVRRILSRFAGQDKGPELQSLSVGTVRSVATGVLGVAFIQALLFGIGFLLAGVPAAGLLAIVVMLIGIIQLPAVIVAVPVIIYVWSAGDASVGANIFYTIFFVIAGLSDNVLKPLLLGRGVDAPMPVVLIGALGGMIAGGFIGLFLGAVLLAIGYQVFMDWVGGQEVSSTELVDGVGPVNP